MAYISQEQKMKVSTDFLAKFHFISNKLRKRFLRKPNVTEASEQFSILATECEQRELSQYAGLCWLAAARCQGTLCNTASEVNLLIKSGRQFLIADKENNDIACHSLGRENIQSAINCYNHSLLRCNGQQGSSSLSAALAMEIGLWLGPTIAGIHLLQQATDICPSSKAISVLVSYYVKQGDFVAALHLLTEFVELEVNFNRGGSGSGNAILHRYEVTIILLLLIIQPSPQRLAPSFTQILEKYTWLEEDLSSRITIDEDELLLLQSLVLACHSQDYQALLELEGELWCYLDSDQKELLYRIIRMLNTK